MNSHKTIAGLTALTIFECKKLWRQKRFSYSASIIGVTSVLGLIAIYLRLVKERSPRASEWLVDILGKYVNGVNFSIAILGASVFTTMPMIVGVFTATCFAGEYQQNQIRTIATRPVSRWAIFFSKFLAMSAFSLVLLATTLVISYAVGSAFFKPSGDIFVWDPGLIAHGRHEFILSEDKAWGRLVLVYALSWFTLTYLVALFLLFAAIVKKTATAIMLPLGLYMSCYVIETMPLLDLLKDFLPTRYIFIAKYSMADPILWGNVLHDGLFTLAFTAILLVAGAVAFNFSDL